MNEIVKIRDFLTQRLAVLENKANEKYDMLGTMSLGCVIEELKNVQKFVNSIDDKSSYLYEWHKQSENDVTNTADWAIRHFICIMKNSSIKQLDVYLDESSDGSINMNYDFENDESLDIDDIVLWTEKPKQ